MRLGLNVSSSSSLDDYGGGALVRFPAWFGEEQVALARYKSVLAAGATPILVLDRRSFTDFGWSHNLPMGSLGLWYSHFPNPPIIEVGNEPDGTGESSSSQTKESWVNFIKAARAVWPRAFIVSGGLSGIDFSYIDVLAGLSIDAVGFHPYAQDADSVKGLITEIKKHTNKPLWATEYGWEYVADQEHQRAKWLSDITVSMWEEGVAAAAVYCGKADQGVFGLIAADGTPLESWAAYTNAIPAVAGDPPNPVPAPDIIQKPSPNYWRGRSGSTVVAIVLHTMDGYLAGTDSTFANPASQVSAHYGVGLDGTIHQYVDEKNSAWANGILEAGNTWPYGSAVNPNYRTISIETEDNANGDTPVSDAQYASVLYLVQQIQTRWPGVADLMAHHVISPNSRPNCPGPRWVASGRMADIAQETGLTLLT